MFDLVMVVLVNEESEDVLGHEEDDQSEEQLFHGSPQCLEYVLEFWRVSEDRADMEGEVKGVSEHSKEPEY